MKLPLRGETRVVGYYTLAAASAEFDFVPVRLAKGLARHLIPLTLLARLADRCLPFIPDDEGHSRVDAVMKVGAGGTVKGIRKALLFACAGRSAMQGRPRPRSGAEAARWPATD